MATTFKETYEEQEELDDVSSMSFLEHLDELRTRLIRITAFVLIAFVVCWIFADKIYHFLEIPVRAAMIEARIRVAPESQNADMLGLADLPDNTEVNFSLPVDLKVGGAFIPANTTIPAQVQRGEDGTPYLVTNKPFVIHNRAVIKEGFVIPQELYAPGSALWGYDNRLVTPTVQGAFNLYIKVAFYAAIFFTVPFILIQVWGFVSPGLYPHEKKYALPFIVMSTFFFLAGVAFAYYIAFPRAANFLLGVAAEGNLRPLVSADEYFDLIILIMLGLGIVFEIPTVTYFLSRLGLVTPRLLIRIWRFAIIVIFIVAAVLSPTTDIPNLLVFAAPMMILYALSIGIAWVFYRKREAEAAGD
ncbi:MAG TPA: twin-arginine translocase subunit TatC [Blastocatellia bacterium]|nr:twin-arginine translocase subunit TatC [Blastocatellia bacterium]